jgi:hypothetical protein
LLAAHRHCRLTRSLSLVVAVVADLAAAAVAVVASSK